MELEKMSCDRCKVESLTISSNEAKRLIQFVPSWTLKSSELGHTLTRKFMFKTFADAFQFASKVAELADQQDHHPKLVIEWGKVSIFWWTHSVNGLHMNDFIMAAKTDALAQSMD